MIRIRRRRRRKKKKKEKKKKTHTHTHTHTFSLPDENFKLNASANLSPTETEDSFPIPNNTLNYFVFLLRCCAGANQVDRNERVVACKLDQSVTSLVDGCQHTATSEIRTLQTTNDNKNTRSHFLYTPARTRMSLPATGGIGIINCFGTSRFSPVSS
jgi:hypothetical protein